MSLTEEQAQAIRGEPEVPHEFTDPGTNRRYVLLAAEVFARLEEEADTRYAAGWIKVGQKGVTLALQEEIPE